LVVTLLLPLSLAMDDGEFANGAHHLPTLSPLFDCCVSLLFAPAALLPPHCCPSPLPRNIAATIDHSHPRLLLKIIFKDISVSVPAQT
jgi:hypothetical protein